MSATKTRINPWTDGLDDTTAVRSILGFCSFALMEMDSGDGVSLSSGDSLGLGFILEACKIALENFDEARATK